MPRGYVYVLTNPCMPGIVKVGMTTRTVEGRAFELYQTGVPTPFDIAYSYLSPDCEKLEAFVHECLADVRVDQRREFFRCEASVARDVIESGIFEQISSIVCEYLDGFTLCEEPFFIDPGDLNAACSQTLDVHPYEFAASVEFIAPAAIQAAVEARRAKVKTRNVNGTALVVVQ